MFGWNNASTHKRLDTSLHSYACKHTNDFTYMHLNPNFHALTRVIPLRGPNANLSANLLACKIARPDMPKNIWVLAWTPAALLAFMCCPCPLTTLSTSQDNVAHVHRWFDTALPTASHVSWRWTLGYPTLQLRSNDDVAQVHIVHTRSTAATLPQKVPWRCRVSVLACYAGVVISFVHTELPSVNVTLLGMILDSALTLLGRWANTGFGSYESRRCCAGSLNLHAGIQLLLRLNPVHDAQILVRCRSSAQSQPRGWTNVIVGTHYRLGSKCPAAAVKFPHKYYRSALMLITIYPNLDALRCYPNATAHETSYCC
jgi:hypothetical protein